MTDADIKAFLESLRLPRYAGGGPVGTVSTAGSIAKLAGLGNPSMFGIPGLGQAMALYQLSKSMLKPARINEDPRNMDLEKLRGLGVNLMGDGWSGEPVNPQKYAAADAAVNNMGYARGGAVGPLSQLIGARRA